MDCYTAGKIFFNFRILITLVYKLIKEILLNLVKSNKSSLHKDGMNWTFK